MLAAQGCPFPSGVGDMAGDTSALQLGSFFAPIRIFFAPILSFSGTVFIWQGLYSGSSPRSQPRHPVAGLLHFEVIQRTTQGVVGLFFFFSLKLF